MSVPPQEPRAPAGDVLADFALGSEAAEQALLRTIAPGNLTLRRQGGRLLVPARADFAMVHPQSFSGPARAALDVVLSPGAKLALAFADHEGAAGALLTADDADSTMALLSGPGAETMTRGAAALRSGIPHHVVLMSDEDRLTLLVDGRTLLAAAAIVTGPRHLVLRVAGGAELRALRLQAQAASEEGSVAPDPRAFWQATWNGRVARPVELMASAPPPSDCARSRPQHPRTRPGLVPAPPPPGVSPLRSGVRGPTEIG